jgi:very-short-patch-repair endonuclease
MASDRARRLQLAGYTVLGFMWSDVVHRPEHVLADLARALNGAGRVSASMS